MIWIWKHVHGGQNVQLHKCFVCGCSDVNFTAWGDREKKRKFLRKQARGHPVVMLYIYREAEAGVCVKENKIYLHYCGSIPMSWRSLLSIQMAKVCIRVNIHRDMNRMPSQVSIFLPEVCMWPWSVRVEWFLVGKEKEKKRIWNNT